MIHSPVEEIHFSELETLMLDRLKSVCGRVYENVPMYKRKFDDAGVEPRHIKSLDDIKKLPFTTKSDLWDQYPFGALAVPKEDILRVHTTSGATGKPVIVGYTRKDLDTWSELMARALTCAGVHKSDRLLNSFNYGLHTTGLGIHYGAERIGAMVIPAGDWIYKRQIALIVDVKATVLCSTPTGALHLATAMRDRGIFKEHIGLRVGIFGGQPWSENMRAELENLLGIFAIDLYGLSEMMGPGVACECIESRNGCHIFMDHFYPEVIDPQTEEVLPHGEEGELVLTTLTRDAFPLIRYRTGDISGLNTEPCSCGRTAWKMKKVMGRTDDMLIIGGVNIFPSQIENVLLGTEEVAPHYCIEVDRVDGLDRLTVTVEATEMAYSMGAVAIVSAEENIKENFMEMLGISAHIKLVKPKTIELKDKSRKVIDRRNI